MLRTIWRARLALCLLDVQAEVEAANWVCEVVMMMELLRRERDFFLVLLRREARFVHAPRPHLPSSCSTTLWTRHT